ncbi:MAG: plastocyanin/azurin family copper-binding protein [Candidatus Paceibacteria bacterium]
MSSGETESFTFTAPKSGTLNLEFECTVPGHAQSGMVGEIDVQ